MGFKGGFSRSLGEKIGKKPPCLQNVFSTMHGLFRSTDKPPENQFNPREARNTIIHFSHGTDHYSVNADVGGSG